MCVLIRRMLICVLMVVLATYGTQRFLEQQTISDWFVGIACLATAIGIYAWRVWVGPISGVP